MIALLLAQATQMPAPQPRITIGAVESLPAQEISCDLRTLDFKEPVRISVRQTGGRAYNADRPGHSTTPHRTPVTIEILRDDTRALEKSYTVRNAPNWLGAMPFKIGGSFKYLRFQPVPLDGQSGLLMGRNTTLAYVVDVLSLQGTGQLIGRCDVTSTKQAPLSAAETKEFLRK